MIAYKKVIRYLQVPIMSLHERLKSLNVYKQLRKNSKHWPNSIQ